MDVFPNEILHHIFTYLSYRYVARCSLVCRTWYNLIILDPFFYKTIEIHSPSQLYKFLNMAITRIVNKKQVGRYVRHLQLEHYYFYQQSLSREVIGNLYSACPFLHSIEPIQLYSYLPFPTTLPISSSFYFPTWQLTTLLNWYPDMNKEWIDAMQERFTSIQLDVQQATEENSNLLSPPSSLDKKRIDSKKIQFVVDEIPTSQIPPHTHDDDIVNHMGYVTYYGKVLSLPTFHQLKILSLDFSNSFNHSRTAIYEIDERTFLSIHNSCPSLEELTCIALFMNMSNSAMSLYKRASADNINFNSKNSPFLQANIPSYPLKSLTLKWCVLNQYQCFDYLSRLYPTLTSLSMDLKWYSILPAKDGPYEIAMYSMITRLTCLKEFFLNDIIYVGVGGRLPYYSGYWPHHLYLIWLSHHPTQLKALKYPYDLKIGDYYNDFGRSGKQLGFLNHLTTLEITISDYQPDTTLYHLLKNGTELYVSTSIVSLTVHNHMKFIKQDPFYIMQWLNAFPTLKEFTLDGIAKIQYQTDIAYQPSYSLQVFKIENSSFKSRKDFNSILYHCSKLRILKLCNIKWDIITTTNNTFLINEQEQEQQEMELLYKKIGLGEESSAIKTKMIINLPDSTLDQFILDQCCFAETKDVWKGEEKSIITRLMVNEHNETHHFEAKNKSATSTTTAITTFINQSVDIVLNCKSVDIIAFK
ncbi:hypothetical protein BJ944DRAFT_263909 [Cunninghamella echinulata]|nr:hypothetical protein BJ944DRAFT_263909 [Cunninghamella echinulata]